MLLSLREKSVGTTELHHSMKKWEHCFSILKPFLSDEKSFQYAKTMFPFFFCYIIFTLEINPHVFWQLFQV